MCPVFKLTLSASVSASILRRGGLTAVTHEVYGSLRADPFGQYVLQDYVKSLIFLESLLLSAARQECVQESDSYDQQYEAYHSCVIRECVVIFHYRFDFSASLSLSRRWVMLRHFAAFTLTVLRVVTHTEPQMVTGAHVFFAPLVAADRAGYNPDATPHSSAHSRIVIFHYRVNQRRRTGNGSLNAVFTISSLISSVTSAAIAA